jgi:putative cardiolipin synthase
MDLTKLLKGCVIGALALGSACSTLPPEPETPERYATSASLSGPLASTRTALTPPLSVGESAFHLLPAAQEALAWRLALIDSAEQSIDVQYFVWHDDAVGSLLMERLFIAAERGVQVRLLVDDLHLVSARTFQGNDLEFAAVDYHPNLELRLFNPGKYRSGTVGAFSSLAGDSLHYNRRMHNKMLLVDGHFAIVGGRNVGNEYFGLDEEFNFVDLDVLVTGAVLKGITAAFDQYWNAELVYPAGALSTVSEQQYQAMRRENTEYVQSKADLLRSFQNLDHGQRLAKLNATLHRGTATFYRDNPVERRTQETRLWDVINKAVAPGSKEVLLSSPYLLPLGDELGTLGDDIRTGAEVHLLTNSLATNNQPAVHSHYKKYRKAILDKGIQLHELHYQPEGELRNFVDSPPVRSGYLGLHMKASVIDGERCIIGTLNFDPRSVNINTEDVLYIKSPGLCGEARDYLNLIFSPDASWKVTQDDESKLHWTSFEGTVDQQPARNFSQRLMDSIYPLVPEGQL